MWFVFSLVTALAWGAADLFYKKGADASDRYSHLRTVIAVGAVMGAHAVIYMAVNSVAFSPADMLRYLPVSACYIISMVLGYFGLRWLELSISSPVQNSSGALVTVLCVIFFRTQLKAIDIAAIAAITVGLVLISVFEKAPQLPGKDKKYRFGATALIFPLLYCIFDALGTFADAIYLDEMEILSESSALLAYEFTFLICAAACTVFLLLKKQPLAIKRQGSRFAAAAFETAGQFFYVFAMSGNAAVAAPLIASYSIVSVILSRIFLREKLAARQYAVIALVIAGIALLGLSEAL